MWTRPNLVHSIRSREKESDRLPLIKYELKMFWESQKAFMVVLKKGFCLPYLIMDLIEWIQSYNQ